MSSKRPNNNYKKKVGDSSITTCEPSTSTSTIHPVVNSMIKKTILGIEVELPVDPYKCQMAVMSKVIKAIKEGENCLLESPTGTGKTLALLCSALAWQKHEEERLRKQVAEEAYFQNAKLKNKEGAVDFIASPKKNTEVSYDIFTRPIHGEKSIYDEPTVDIEECNSIQKKRKEPLNDSTETDYLVGINKKVKLSVPEKIVDPSDANEAQERLTTNKDSISNEKCTSLPIIYYGARTHKQLEQVIQEFSRTTYAGKSVMTILSSRDHSCIREYDRNRWPSKNDMCRGCTKTQNNSSPNETNCIYYDNHRALKNSLPRTFNLETLVSTGIKKQACPYYAARKMASIAHIVFCPYSYLIEPSIRKSMQINLENNIVIIDEGHNIEDICREAATFTFTQANMADALKELTAASSLRFANNETINYITYLQKSLEEWCSWFNNQKPLIDKQTMKGTISEYDFNVDNFVKTLNNHNIGQKEYPEFHKHAEVFCKKFRDDPRLLLGITQSTNTLIENLDIVLGYLFRNSCESMDDYQPILVKEIQSNDTTYNNNWSRSKFIQKDHSESLSLKLWCLNPAVLFAPVLSSRCVVLASGTLTPMTSLHSELGTTFKHTISPRHVIPSDRVWVGSLKADLSGEKLCCDSASTKRVDIQDSLGEAVRRVCEVTPHGVLCFLPSYRLMNLLVERWRQTKIWEKLNELKQVFKESTNMEKHVIDMKKFDCCVGTSRGALLLAVYRGKVAEGMDFKDHQARAVIAVGIPYPSQDTAVKAKKKYNDKYAVKRTLSPGFEWCRIQAYRALNQAVGRVVRHAGDWGAVLLVDGRYQNNAYCEHLAKWVKEILGKNHHDFNTLFNSDNGLEAFMKRMMERET